MKKEITHEQKVKAIQALAKALWKKRLKHLGLETEHPNEKEQPKDKK